MTSTSKFSHVLRSALATALVFGAQIVSAQALSNSVTTGSVVQFSKANNLFTGAVTGGPGAGTTFASFCVEKLEEINLNVNAYVGGVTTATTNGSAYATSSDPLSSQTAWLFTQYSSGLYGNSSTVNGSMQNAIWFLEGEINQTTLSLDSDAQTFVTSANASNFSGVGNVRVMNLYSNVGRTAFAQDQLVMLAPVPEPETYAMLLAGLGVMGAVVRRRKQKMAA
jgi:hypothetical protein